MKRINFGIVIFLCFWVNPVFAQNYPEGGADEKTPSYSEYFSWINNTNEGPTSEQTMANLDFFKWLKERFGMKLDIYAFDAGAIDGAKKYGSTKSERFRSQFPYGFKPISDKAGAMGTRLGVWLGPDGYGETDKDAAERSDMLVDLVKNHNFQLFKMDAVCGNLRADKYDYFDKTMSSIRRLMPNFILLNHRLNLGWTVKHSTTFLLGGEETYIDVFMTNNTTAPHHRAAAISRLAPDNLTRLTEDHGVCLSSCLDYWEDDLVLQAFNRSLILAPQIYANPWLLRDDEFSYLAYIFNLHKDNSDLLVNAIKLPNSYGTGAISRGDSRTRFLTLRNLTWMPVKYSIRLDNEIGLSERKNVKARLYHPYIYDLGVHDYGSIIEVEVLPFRVALVKFTTETERDKVALSGIPYHIINDRAGGVAEIKLLGKPGMTYKMSMERGRNDFISACIDDLSKKALLSGKSVNVRFEGEKCKSEPHRKISDMIECQVPSDISAVYYATCFAADNNALEVRSLKRSGETSIPQVKAARDTFFGQELFKTREIWDKNLFDGNPATAFSVAMRWGDVRNSSSSELCLDLGENISLDRLDIETFDEYSLAPLKSYEGVEAFVSDDLLHWTRVVFDAGVHMSLDLSAVGTFRYLRFSPVPLRLSEITGYKDGKQVNRSKWRASNLFRPYGGWACTATQTWKSSFVLDDIEEGAYLCVAVNGFHGTEGVWAGFKIDGQYIGCPDRAPSFASNTWEYRSASRDHDYTYYLPLTKDMEGKNVEAYVMSLDRNVSYVNTDRPDERKGGSVVRQMLKPEIWLTAYPIPMKSKKLVMKQR